MSDLKDLEIRLYQPGDEEGIVDLLDLCFDNWLKTHVDSITYWSWKYVDSPFWKNDITLGILEDAIIACKHSLYFKLKIGDEILNSTLGSDLVVHPEYRNMGVSKRVREFNRNRKRDLGYDFTYYVTSNPILIKTLEGSREMFPHDVRVFVRVKDVDLQLEKIPMEKPMLIKIGFQILERINSIRNVFRGRVMYRNELTLTSIDKFSDKYDDAWEKIQDEYRFIVERTTRYLNWRYCDPRAGDFRIRIAKKDGEPLGYSVVFINRYLEDYPIGYIIDILSYPDRVDVIDSLVRDAVRFFDENGVNIINTITVKGHPLEDVLAGSGFVNVRIGLKIFFGRHGARSQDPELKTIIRESPPERIHFSYGDIDSLPVTPPDYTRI